MLLQIFLNSPYSKSRIEESLLSNEEVAQILEEIAHQVREGNRHRPDHNLDSHSGLEEVLEAGVGWTIYYKPLKDVKIPKRKKTQ